MVLVKRIFSAPARFRGGLVGWAKGFERVDASVRHYRQENSVQLVRIQAGTAGASEFASEACSMGIAEKLGRRPHCFLF